MSTRTLQRRLAVHNFWTDLVGPEAREQEEAEDAMDSFWMALHVRTTPPSDQDKDPNDE